jgi:hypothetical protein
VKARLAVLENKHKVIEDEDGKKPSLPRHSPAGKNGGEDTRGDENGRPRLNRRQEGDQ